MKCSAARMPYDSHLKEDMRCPNAVPCPVANMVPVAVDKTHPKLPLLSCSLPSVAIMKLWCRCSMTMSVWRCSE